MNIDWSKHTPREVRLALEAAPKVAGPWTRVPVDGRPLVFDWRRRGTRVGELAGDVAEVWHFQDEPASKPTYSAPRTGIEACASIEDGKARADAALVDAGWLLDNEVP
jgi:hypothetical protein